MHIVTPLTQIWFFHENDSAPTTKSHRKLNKTKVESVKLEKAFDFEIRLLGREGYNFKACVGRERLESKISLHVKS